MVKLSSFATGCHFLIRRHRITKLPDYQTTCSWKLHFVPFNYLILVFGRSSIVFAQVGILREDWQMFQFINVNAEIVHTSKIKLPCLARFVVYIIIYTSIPKHCFVMLFMRRCVTCSRGPTVTVLSGDSQRSVLHRNSNSPEPVKSWSVIWGLTQNVLLLGPSVYSVIPLWDTPDEISTAS